MPITKGRGSESEGFSTMWNQADLVIGNFCSISSDAMFILGGNHRTDWFTTHTFEKSYSMPNPEGHPRSNGEIFVGNDVWIGQKAVVFSGVKIYDGAVVGAYSIVRQDIPPYAIVVGNPAKVIKYRFSDEVIDRLLELKWWNWEDEKIKRNIDLLCSELTLDKLYQLEKEGLR